MSEFFYGGVVFNNFGPRTNMTSLDYKMRINPKVGWSDTNYLFFPVTVPGPSIGHSYGTFAKMQNLIDMAFIEMSNPSVRLLPTGNNSGFDLVSGKSCIVDGD